METNRILLGNCQKVLVDVPDNSVDLTVTDPPYGYSFMGKDWDKAVPRVAIWRECLRVSKPGAFAFVMSSPRADVLSHMIVNLSDAGFRTDFTPIYWAYASGFPKSCNIGKAVDKRLGLTREVVGKKTGRAATPVGDIRGGEFHAGGGVPSAYDNSNITEPASQEAKLLDGSYGGFQPKPAVEVIIVAMKPLSKKTFVDQALANQKGVTWLDDCRIPFRSKEDLEQANTTQGGKMPQPMDWETSNGLNIHPVNPEGRFPANLLVSDDILNDGHERVSKYGKSDVGTDNQMGFRGISSSDKFIGDMGSFSRYFSLDSWFEKQLKKLPIEVQKTFPFLLEPKASKSERNKNLDTLQAQSVRKEDGSWGSLEIFSNSYTEKSNNPTSRGKTPKHQNFHPTVKPLQLMSYLITLGSRPNDLILDPFAGSGTTCLAAKMLGRRYLGIELNKDYYEIAQARVENHKTLFEFASEMKNIS